MKKRMLFLVLLLLAGVDFSASAEQTKEAHDGATIKVDISDREPTRIRIDGAKIADVVGNIYSSSNCAGKSADAAQTPPAAAGAVNASGQFTLVCNLAKGEVYIQPVGASNRPINLFISSSQATYTLRLRRVDMPSDTIVIADKSAKRVDAGAGAARNTIGKSANYVRNLKSMLVAMVSDNVPADIRAEERDEARLLWAESDIRLVRHYEGRGLIGETYLLTNISAAPLVLAEQEFDREEGNVLAVSITNLNLRPRDSTHVYVIRAGE